jgi:8-oxo-dGTP pyrophosphatase MutT (NUDIX family)
MFLGGEDRLVDDKLPEWKYRQSAVIPYRRGPDRVGPNCGSGDGVEVLLITSRGRKRWVPPKGVVEPGMTAADSAAKEAFEEAGIRGRVDDRPFGAYRYRKRGGTGTVAVFAMEVSEECDDWPEPGVRTREWLPPQEAAARVDEAALKEMIAALPEWVGS